MYRSLGFICYHVSGSGAFCKPVKGNREIAWRYQKWECWHE